MGARVGTPPFAPASHPNVQLPVEGTDQGHAASVPNMATIPPFLLKMADNPGLPGQLLQRRHWYAPATATQLPRSFVVEGVSEGDAGELVPRRNAQGPAGLNSIAHLPSNALRGLSLDGASATTRALPAMVAL